jgi:hypothetical protein
MVVVPGVEVVVGVVGPKELKVWKVWRFCRGGNRVLKSLEKEGTVLWQ